jgi:hypothetical protein
MQEKELIGKVVNLLSDIDDAETRSAFDFEEFRSQNTISVGIENTTQMNVGLPDYKYSLRILIACFINEDSDGTIIDSIRAEVVRRLSRFILNEGELSELFEEIPVVGFFFTGEQNTTDETSNRAILTYDIIASFQ